MKHEKEESIRFSKSSKIVFQDYKGDLIIEMRNIIKFMITNIKKCANYHFHVICARNKHYKSQNKCGPGSIVIFGVHISSEYHKANCKATLKSKEWAMKIYA